MPSVESYDVVLLGSGIAGLGAALAAHEAGMRAVVVEKAAELGGTTSESYGLIWIGDNHLMRASGEIDPREDIIGCLSLRGGGALDEERMIALVDRSPGVLKFFRFCGDHVHVAQRPVHHCIGVAQGARAAGRT